MFFLAVLLISRLICLTDEGHLRFQVSLWHIAIFLGNISIYLIMAPIRTTESGKLLSPMPSNQEEQLSLFIPPCGRKKTAEKAAMRKPAAEKKIPVDKKPAAKPQKKAATPKPAQEKKARVQKSTPNNIKTPAYPAGKWSPSVLIPEGDVNEKLARQVKGSFSEIYYVLVASPPPSTPFEHLRLLDQKLAYLNLNHGHLGQHRRGGDAAKRRSEAAIEQLERIVVEIEELRSEHRRTSKTAFPPESILPYAAEIVGHVEMFYSYRDFNTLRYEYWPAALELYELLADVRQRWIAQEGLHRREPESEVEDEPEEDGEDEMEQMEAQRIESDESGEDSEDREDLDDDIKQMEAHRAKLLSEFRL